MTGSPREARRITHKARPRARDIGIDIGVLLPGKFNAITDVAGVGVGHVTLTSGEGKLVPGKGPVRTGVTVVTPHADNLFEEKVPAAAFALNAFGKAIGLEQLTELGNLETPIALTNTLNAPLVADALIEWAISRNPDIGISTSTVNPVVGEVNDGYLNDIQGRHVHREHVFAAIDLAVENARGAAGRTTGWIVGEETAEGAASEAHWAAQGADKTARRTAPGTDGMGAAVRAEETAPAVASAQERVGDVQADGAAGACVAEGSVGAGTGACCMGWKGGIGTSSRVLPEARGGYTLGALVLTNFGGILTVNGAPVGRELGRYAFSGDFPYGPQPGPRRQTDETRLLDGERPSADVQHLGGSVIVVLATDAPLDHRQLERLARRAGLGLARTGFFSSNGSGDFFIAFSTARRIPHRAPLAQDLKVLSNDAMSALFLAAVEATEEAVVNSILRATTVVGRDGHVAEAIDIDDLVAVLKKYNALGWHRRLPPWGYQ
ncbi:MAG TPA: P1 family peptidase [Firmicutes bacterium]|nr:P1 family peptidase [Bacillota bacterium]